MRPLYRISTQVQYALAVVTIDVHETTTRAWYVACENRPIQIAGIVRACEDRE